MSHQRRTALTLLLVPALLCCQHHDPTSPPPDASPDAGWADPLDDGGSRPCVRACATLARLRCVEGGLTPAGVPCGVWLCESDLSTARLMCVAAAASCSAARGCQ